MIEVSAAIITNGSEVLCFQKGVSKRDYLSYKYEFPGGKIEKEETLESAIIRELKEELDFNASKLHCKKYITMCHDYDDFSVTIHYFIIFCKEPAYVLNEHISSRWMKMNEITTLDWADADMKIAKLLEESGIE